MTVAAPPGVALRIIYQGWATFGIATLSERDGSTVQRVFEDHGAASCVLPYDPVRRVALIVTQRRVGPLLCGESGDLAEAPAGGLDADEPAAAARRETLEEVGVRLGALEPVGSPFAMPGVSTERIHLFLAPYGASDRVAAGGGLAAEGEQLIVAEVALADLSAQASAGTLHDLKTLALVQALQLRRPELFPPVSGAEAPSGRGV